jgi:solute carrier family 35 protein F5
MALDNEEETLLSGPKAVRGQTSPPKTPRSIRIWRLAQGIACLVAVALIWVAAGQLVQYLYSEDVRLPFFLTYLNVSEFIVLLPLQWLRERYAVKVCGRTLLTQAPRSPWKAAARAGLIVCPLWFLAQGSYNWSLGGTSVSSSTVLSTTSCVFTFALSLLFLKESFRWSKLLGVVVTLAGAALVAYSDRTAPDEGANVWWGDALALFSAVMYALYTTAIRRLVPDGSDISMNAFFGFLGLFNSLLLSPVVGILHATKVEVVSGVPASFIGLLLLKGLFDNVLSDLLWARAIQLTSPTVATVALSLTIPIAMLSDLVLHSIVPAALVIVGAVAVAGGFVLSTVSLDGVLGPEPAPGGGSDGVSAGSGAAPASAPEGVETDLAHLHSGDGIGGSVASHEDAGWSTHSRNGDYVDGAFTPSAASGGHSGGGPHVAVLAHASAHAHASPPVASLMSPGHRPVFTPNAGAAAVSGASGASEQERPSMAVLATGIAAGAGDSPAVRLTRKGSAVAVAGAAAVR